MMENQYQETVKRMMSTAQCVDPVCCICKSSEGNVLKTSEWSWVHPACAEKARVERLQKNIKEALSKRGVRARYLDCSFDNYKPKDESSKKASVAMRNVDSTFTGSIFLTSARSGTGKTHLAVATMRNLLWSGFTDVLFVSSPYLFLEIKNSFNGDESESKVINKYCNVKFLIIDDIGVEKVSEWAMQIWYMIIDRRYSEMMPTIYTSNLSIGDVAESLGKRIASRLSSGYVLTLDSNDYRLENRPKL